MQPGSNAFAVIWLGEQEKDRYLSALEDYGAGPG
jgi:hypothetical protein